MNDHCQEPTEKGALVDALLAIDSRLPGSSAEGREIAKEALRRDRRRVRILTGLTIGFFLLTVGGICLSVFWYYVRVVPGMHRYERDISVLQQQLAKREPQPSQPDLLDMTARMTVGQGYAFFMIQLINLWGISVLFALVLAAAFCTVLLIMATRRATLRQIQISLSVLSEQLDALQRSLQTHHPAGGGQATQDPSG